MKFVDQGEAVTTTHYYVIMNPNADLSAVEDYIIAPIVPNNPGDEMVNEYSLYGRVPLRWHPFYILFTKILSNIIDNQLVLCYNDAVKYN